MPFDISIHAPTRGATLPVNDISSTRKFQSTLPREERLGSLALMRELGLFQSTLPREERPFTVLSLWIEGISIHAPTRGATQTKVVIPPNKRHFNPRSHERSDHYWLWYLISQLYFNPRSHERSDIANKLNCLACQIISIHAPTRGATPAIRVNMLLSSISIHAPTRGATGKTM